MTTTTWPGTRVDESGEPIPAPLRSLELHGRTISVRSFRHLGAALSFAARCEGPGGVVVLGDCPWHWVVTPADARRLERAGYEIVTFSSLKGPKS